MNVLKLISSRGEPTRLEQLGHVEGIVKLESHPISIKGSKSIRTNRLVGQPIGSAFIDRKIYDVIRARLEKIEDHLSLPPSETAWKMISGRFQRLKCAFGTEATATPWLKLDVPLSEPNADYVDAEIFDGQMQIKWYIN